MLVDPLLCEDYGEAYALGYRMYPPRRLDAAAFPPVDALILTHEHDDHFDIPSLARLDRDIPVFLSMHSSSAAFQILRDMGFAVSPLVPGAPLRVSDLEIVAFCGDHLSINSDDEWDALPFIIRDLGGSGSLFSMVDIMMVPGHLAWAKACAARPGLVTWTNNTLDWGFMAEYLADVAAAESGTQPCIERMDTGRQMIRSHWGEPAAMLMCAGGFTFQGERGWLNDRVFGIDVETVARVLGSRHPGERFFSTIPGQTFWMESNRLVKVDERTPFLGALPRAEWTARRHEPIAIPDYTPATGRRDLGDGDAARLDAALQELAAVLVGGILFRSLHSLLTVMTGNRKPTFALILRHGTDGAALVYEYDASACAFVPGVAEGTRDVYLACMACWATDLLAVLTGELGPISMAYGRARLWNALPQGFRFDLFEAMYRLSHPLRRPAAFLKTYRRILEKQADVVPVVRAAVGMKAAKVG